MIRILKFIRLALFSFVLVLPETGLAQFGEHGEVFVTNDYRQTTKPTLVVKWFSKKVYYKDGFHVYRRSEHESEWSRVTSAPLKVKSVVPPSLAQRDPEIKAFLEVVNKTPYEEFQKGVPRVFVVMKAITSPDFAELLGIIYYDENVETGKKYQYEVRGISSSKEEVVNISPSVIVAPYEKPQPPQDILVQRKINGIEINWKPEELRYYGVNLYRRANGLGDWKKISKQPRNVYKSADQSGTMTYPNVFYFDTPVSKDTVYEYQLTATDYFGQESIPSGKISVPVIDFENPLPPFGLETSVNVLNLSLNWKIQESVDLAGFKVYRSANADSTMKVVHEGLLPKDQNKYEDHLTKTGGYYYMVSAVDDSGNEGLSEKIFIEVRDVTPPLPPINVTVKTDTGKVMLTWAANSEADLRGYYVYRSLHDGKHHDNEFIVLNTKPLTQNHYSEVLPKNVRNKFVYTVVAEDQSYNRSKMSAFSVVQLPDATSPAKPLLVNISIKTDTLLVRWLANAERDLAGYHIFRSSDSASFKRINEKLHPAKMDTYADTDINPHQRYFYYITAVDSAGNTSLPSNVYSAVNKIGDDKIKIDTKLEYIKTKREVRISWTLNHNTKIAGAVIFRSHDNMNFRPITGMLKESTYSDKEITKGATYFYQVRSYDQNGSVAHSNVIKTTITE